MDANDKAEFLESLTQLAGAHDRSLTTQRIEGYWKTLERMPLATFRGVIARCHERLQSLGADNARFPTASSLWDTARELRNGRPHGTATSPAKQSQDGADNWHGDGWTVNANLLLMQHVASHKAGIDYAPDTSLDAAQKAVPGPITRHVAGVLHEAALDWAFRMRAGAERGKKPDGKALWHELIKGADDKIRDYLGLTTHPAETAPF
jgi:peptidoglycan/xylan/chitin deacetylase (PgdA/CDA1 family)